MSLALLHALALAVLLQEPPPAPAPASDGTGTEGQTAEPPSVETPVGSGGAQETQENGGDKKDEPPPDRANEPPGADAIQQAPAPDPTVVAPAAPEPAPAAPARPTFDHPLSIDEIHAAMRELAARHPELVALESIGRSAGGRELLVLTLSDLAAGPARDKPALLVVDHLPAAGVFGAEVALELAWTLAQSFAADPAVRALLRETALVVAPALDPDARADGAAPGVVVFDLNFPLGWQPETLRKGSGSTPMARPETQAAVAFLERQRHVVLALGVGANTLRGAPYPGAELPAEDRAVLETLAAGEVPEGGPRLVPWHQLGSPGGGLMDYAYQARGIYPLALAAPGEEELARAGLAGWVRAAATRAAALLTALPRLSIVQEGLERLAPGLWQLDVRLQNSGAVPTLSGLGRGRMKAGEITLGVRGAKLVATARRAASGASYVDAAFLGAEQEGRVPSGTLAGGEGRWLRLLLEGEAGAQVEIGARSAWTADARLTLVLL